MDDETQSVVNTEDYKSKASVLVKEVFETAELVSSFTVSDIMDKTGLSRPSVQRVLNELVAIGKISKTGFKQRVGHVYTPVASDHFRVVIGKEVYNTKQLLKFIATSPSPHGLVTEDKWRNFMKVFMCLVMQSEDVPYSPEQVVSTLTKLRNETIELQKLIAVMLNDFNDEASKMMIEKDLAEMRRADRNFSPVNFINFVMNSKNEAA